MSSNSKLHAAILSSPGMGHLVPVLELGKTPRHRPRRRRNDLRHVLFHVRKPSPQTIKAATTPKLRIVEIPPVDISGLVDPHTAVFTCLAVMMREIRPAFRSALRHMAFSSHHADS
ncbi:hypothetical protein M0R45_004262 [Rubus argutus]|uniref:Uncharacterized protein n=1 Tax=Rubus argutus TaxID=59490 RepID=A0AAW1YJA5_RUBAR